MTDPRVAASLLCGLCLLLSPSLVRTAQPDAAAAPLDALSSVPGVTWSDVDVVWLSGMPIPVRRFQADDGLSRVAQRFVQARPQLRRMLLANGSLLLSGIDGSQSLVVQLQALAQGTEGFATVLDTTQASQHASAQAQDSDLDWLVSGAVRVFSLRQASRQAMGRQTIHWVDTPLAALTQRLGSRLPQLGWQPWPVISLPGRHGAWQRHGDVLLLLPDPDAKGSLLYQLRQEDKGQP